METTTLTIINKTGLHTRPGKNFVQLAKQFEAAITLEKEGSTYNAKSLLKIMKAGICQGDEIRLSADGSDEKEAITALKSYIENLDPEA
ncbi:MAG: HPr family phosphocarrier protein [Alphaproteobacteria bacterium]